MSLDFDNIMSTITLVTLLAIVIGDRVLGWLKTRGVDLSKTSETYELAYNIQQDTQELLKRFDDSPLEKAVEALSNNIAAQTELLREMVTLNKLSHQEHKLILDLVSNR